MVDIFEAIGFGGYSAFGIDIPLLVACILEFISVAVVLFIPIGIIIRIAKGILR